jgi:hypothetical protein
MAITTAEIWQHRTSGDVFLVEVAGDGTEFGETSVRSTFGPLPLSEAEYTLNEASGWFNGTDIDNEWFEQHADDFRVLAPYVSG